MLGSGTSAVEETKSLANPLQIVGAPGLLGPLVPSRRYSSCINLLTLLDPQGAPKSWVVPALAGDSSRAQENGGL